MIEPLEVEPWEPPVVTIAEAASGRYPCLTWGGREVSFWCIPDGDGVDIEPCLLSRFPFPYPSEEWAREHTKSCAQHALDFEIGNIGLSELLDDWKHGEFAFINWMLETGLAPGLPFRIWAAMVYEKAGPYDCEEWDAYMEWDIVEVARLTEDGLTPEQAWLRWAETLPPPPLPILRQETGR